MNLVGDGVEGAMLGAVGVIPLAVCICTCQLAPSFSMRKDSKELKLLGVNKEPAAAMSYIPSLPRDLGGTRQCMSD